jgi:ABC-type branched-subunit amino acid transport system ATPase component
VMESGQVILEGTAEELIANEQVQRAYLGRSGARAGARHR